MDALSEMLAAVAAVRRRTGLDITVKASPDSPSGLYQADAVITVGQPTGSPLSFLTEHKTRIAGEAQLSLIRQRLLDATDDACPLLVTYHLTDRQIDHCMSIGLNFMDASGNCLIRAGSLWIQIRGNRPVPHATSPAPYKGGASYASLRVVYALLCAPTLLAATYRDVAASAGVSLGAVPPILGDLERRALLTPRSHGKSRHLLHIDRLQDEWVTNYPNKLRPRLRSRRFTAPAPDWWRDADIGANALWGGEVAAYRMDGHLRPITQTIYVQAGDTLNDLLRLNRLRADPGGAVEILDRFWHFDDVYKDKLQTVHPLLAYADLLSINDSRAAEAAKRLRKEHLNAAIEG